MYKSMNQLTVSTDRDEILIEQGYDDIDGTPNYQRLSVTVDQVDVLIAWLTEGKQTIERTTAAEQKLLHAAA